MVGGAVAHSAATTEPDVPSLETAPAGAIAPRRGNVHDVECTI